MLRESDARWINFVKSMSVITLKLPAAAAKVADGHCVCQQAVLL